jgi:hypothetical protein
MKTLKSLGSLVVAGILLTGCMGSKNEPEIKKTEFKCQQNGTLAPQWTCTPFIKGSITALGIAKMNAGNDKSMQRTEAIAEARDLLASQVSTKVSTLFKSYKATTGSGNSSTFDATVSKVSKQLASQTLNGSHVVKSWTNPNTKELFVLVGISNDSVKNGMDKAVKSSFKNEKALYQKFQASKAQGELDKELEKTQ